MDSPIILLLAYLLVFISAFILVFSWFPQKDSELRERTGLDIPKEWSEDITLLKWFYPLVILLQPLVKRIPVDDYKKMVELLVIRSGVEQNATRDEIIGLQIVLSVFLPTIFLQYIDSIVGGFIIGVLGFILPLYWLWDKKNIRQKAMVLSFPSIVDMLALSVEAGTDFNTAIIRLCEQYKGKREPLIDEFVLYQHNLRLGMNKEDSLNKLADRVGLSDVYSFCSVLIQADKMGASISEMLKEQSKKLRKERFLRAEKLGAEASQKLMVPMIIFIFPLLFFIVLGPYILNFIYGK